MSHKHSKRTSDHDLPAGDEIMHISDAEEKRQPPQDKIHIHYPNFATIIALYEHFGLDPSIYTKDALTPQYILDTGREHVETLTKNILETQLNKSEIEMLNAAYAYLAEEDTSQKADYIYVFGAKTPFRAHKAVELYKQGLAPKMILSGGGPFYGSDTMTEAEKYAEIALKSGIPEEDLIIEDASITIPDNVRRTLNMMDVQKLPYNSFILVNSPYTQRRGWCSWKKHLSDTVKLYRVNCETGDQFSPDNWYKNETGLKVVLGEFPGLRNTMAFNDA